jgi:hypothetical protein
MRDEGGDEVMWYKSVVRQSLFLYRHRPLAVPEMKYPVNDRGRRNGILVGIQL